MSTESLMSSGSLPAGVTLRWATPADVPEILALIYELAVYEHSPGEAKATPEQLRRALFGDPAKDGKGAGVAECIMGEVDGRVQGLSFFFMNYSTWTGKAGLYLEDLFVRPEYRGRGLGGALLKNLAKLAIARGCARVEWSVLDWNKPAIEFYLKMGAVAMSEWTVFRVQGDALAKLGG